MSFLFPKSVERDFIISDCEGIEYSGTKNSNTSTLLYLKWITSKDLLNTTWNSATVKWQPGWEGEFEGEWIYVCVYIWLSPFDVHLKL